MGRLEVKTAEGVTLGLEIPGPGTRLTAALLDGLVLVGAILTAVLVLRLAADLDPSGVSAFLLWFVALGSALFVVAYHVLFHWRDGGQTPGKKAVGIRVVGLDGQPASLLQLCLRSVLLLADLMPVPLALGLVVMALTDKCQRLGDLAAGTLVVRDPARSGRAFEPWPEETWETLQVRVLHLTPAAASRFDVEDRVFLRDVITRRGLDPFARRRLLHDVAAHYCAKLGIERAEDPRIVIKELYLFLRSGARHS